MTIYLSKQQALDPNPKLIQQINFTGNLDWGRQTALYYIIEEAKKNQNRFFWWKCGSIVNLFCFNAISV